jgi:FkbM family methyltransferase
MSITSSIKRLLYRRLSLEKYLRVVSRCFFAGYSLGVGRRSTAYEYPRFLRSLVRRGDTVLDIGANLGYFSRIMSRLVGEGKIWAVEPVRPILGVLKHNLRRCRNVEIVPFALGSGDGNVRMVNDSARIAGYMGTGRNHIADAEGGELAMDDIEFEVEMRRGSELFGSLGRLDFIKCDIEGYESVVIPEMATVIERHLPVVLIETSGAARVQIAGLFHGWGYTGYIVNNGRLVAMEGAPEKDIVFIPAHRREEFKHLIVE